MKYDFDEIIDRRGTGSVRWDSVMEKYDDPDVLPLTTADMGFRIADPIRDAIKQSADFGIYGYTRPKDSYYEAVIQRLKKVSRWDVKRDWISYSAGIVEAVAFCIQGMTEPGDAIALITPMYHPFAHLIEDNGRVEVYSELIQPENGRTVIDFESLEKILSDENTKMLIFCNPHNPIGRAWEEDELDKVAALCVKYNVILVSDEIHCDFVYSGHTFTSLGPCMEKAGGSDQLIICSAASKSYNIAGLQCSAVIIPGENLRSLYQATLMRIHYMEMNAIGPVATEAAYRYCDDWMEQVLAYLEETRNSIMEYTKENLPGIRAIEPEATYMIWFDCRELGMSEPELGNWLIKRAKVGLNMGSTFGPGGEGYVRMNFAEPRTVIFEALERISKALKEL